METQTLLINDANTLSSEIKLSVVIRARNEADNLQKVFGALQAQCCDFGWEIVVVDNSSEDRTVEICRKVGAKVVSISREEFSYGRALNRGIIATRGEIILILSAHAIPIGHYFFKSLVMPFQDPLMAAVRCLSVYDFEQIVSWYRPLDIQYSTADEQKAAESKGRKWTRDYPAATCMALRRSIWEKFPFNEEIEAVEDKLWASVVLSHGYKIRRSVDAVYYVPELRNRKIWRRKRQREFIALYRISGYIPLRWPDFFRKVIGAIISAPYIAVRSVMETFWDNFILVVVPWKAKKTSAVGSLPEFDKPTRRL